MASESFFAPPRTVVLVGMMGAGKTSIGRRLAARLGVPFVDADAEIEQAAGSSIADIFERHGEEAFRDGERRVIARLLDGPVHVMATGGGAFLDEGTRELIRSRAISVWLRASLDTLAARLEKSRTPRPLLDKEGDLRTALARLIDERYPVYQKAQITVETGDGPHDPVVDSVYDALQVFLEEENPRNSARK
ncbi:MAG: shikimate kinase [Proteobacteria bacterium]|nr:shikimate kinase [Pseudomonadota bacterium]